MPQTLTGYEVRQMDLSIKQQIEIDGIGMECCQMNTRINPYQNPYSWFRYSVAILD